MNPKGDTDKLIGEIVPFAKQMLAEHGEFHPFGGFMGIDRAINHAGGEVAGQEFPRGVDLIRLLEEGLRERARTGQIVAAAIVSNVRVKTPGSADKSDAIQATVEHCDAYCADVFYPYMIDRQGTVTYGPVFAQAGVRRIFVDRANEPK